MNNPISQDELAGLINENKMLKRRVERMTKEMKNLTALHDRAVRLRDYSEREKNLQYEYNILLLENAPDMLFILDPEMRFRLGTKALLRFLGKGEDYGRLRGSSFRELFKGVMPGDWIESTRARFESVANGRGQMKYNDKVVIGGGVKVFSISVAPAVDSIGRIMGVICLMHDSTELVGMKEAAEAATQAKSSFLASMSHEIRTPMNAIKGFSDLMAKTSLSSRQKAYVDNIIAATANLLMIINDILDFSKIEANKYEIVNEPYDTIAELAELCGLMQPKAYEKGIYFFADVDPRLPSSLIGDSLRIRQILINLISNAIKFTHKGGVIFSVSAQRAGEDKWLVTCAVKDTGQGIRADELPKIFRAFEQADYYKNKKISGTGLGLAISKNLAELMGGEISVSSEYGVGSEFTVRIPQAAAGGKAVASVERPEEKNVLLLYSNDEIAALTQRALERLGVAHKRVLGADMLREAARGEGSPTHILIDGALELAQAAAEICPDAQIAYLQSVSDPETGMPDNVRVLFKPVLSVDLAAFIGGGDGSFINQRAKADMLGAMSFEGARVMIVDDNDINLVVASEIIRTYSIEPETASSGFEALEKLKNKEYDLIFMDHMMPGMDGIEATAAIRAMNIAQPAVIALTANAIFGMEELYVKSGFDGYITKPISVEGLNAILEKWLGKSGHNKVKATG